MAPRRRKPLRRGKPLRQGKPLARKTPLDSRSELKRTPIFKGKPDWITSSFAPLPAAARPAWLVWVRSVTKGRRCLVCGGGVILDPHHVIPQRLLRRRVRPMLKHVDRAVVERFLIGLLTDPANGVALCRDCHEAHESGSRRIRLDELPAAAVEWAVAHEFKTALHRLYA